MLISWVCGCPSSLLHVSRQFLCVSMCADLSVCVDRDHKTEKTTWEQDNDTLASAKITQRGFPGEEPQKAFYVIQRWRIVSWGGLRSQNVKKRFPNTVGRLLSVAKAQSSKSALSSRKVKRGSGTWCFRLRASDWPLPLLCGEMRVSFPFSLPMESATALFNTLFKAIFIKPGTSATCSPPISASCGGARRCADI